MPSISCLQREVTATSALSELAICPYGNLAFTFCPLQAATTLLMGLSLFPMGGTTVHTHRGVQGRPRHTAPPAGRPRRPPAGRHSLQRSRPAASHSALNGVQRGEPSTSGIDMDTTETRLYFLFFMYRRR